MSAVATTVCSSWTLEGDAEDRQRSSEMRIKPRCFTPLLIAAAAAASIVVVPIAAADPGARPSCPGPEIAVEHLEGPSDRLGGQTSILECSQNRYRNDH